MRKLHHKITVENKNNHKIIWLRYWKFKNISFNV